MTVGLLLFKSSKYSQLFTYRDIILNIVVVFSFNIVFFTLIPVTAERSVSIFLLEYMSKHADRAFSHKEITQVFSEEFIDKHEGINKRFHEQIISGNIRQTGDRYKITEQGQFLMKLYIIIGDMFKIGKRNLSP